MKAVMKNVFVIVLVLVNTHGLLAAQFYAVASGNWNQSGVWSNTAGGPALTCSPCLEGTHYPGANDNARTEGFSINIPDGFNANVLNLLIQYNVADGITSDFFGVSSITIFAQLAAVFGSGSSTPTAPTTSIISPDLSATDLTLIFAGNARGTTVNLNWNSLAPLPNVQFNPTLSGSILTMGAAVSLADFATLTVVNGTLQLNGNLSSAGTNGTITVNSGAILSVDLGNINGDGSVSSFFPTILVNGTLTSVSNTNSYINASTIMVNANGILNVGFNGANQTQGWWFQSNSPTTLNIDPLSTVIYSANAAQNIYPTTYGNLSLTSASAVTKTLIGSGLTIQGNLTIGTNVTFSPASQVDFTGTGAQSISGGGPLNFTGGLEVNKPSGTVTLNQSVSASGVFRVSSGALDLGNVTTTLTDASVINDGTITSAAGGSLFVSGTSIFSGSGSTSLNNLTISSGSTNFNKSVTLTGNLVNNGSLSFSSTATVTFTGGTGQSITGNAMTIGHMAISKSSSTLSNNAEVRLTGVLTLTTGTFDADGSGGGNFILNSDPNGDAAIGPMGSGSITGEVTFERWFNNTQNRWRNLSFPVTSVTHAELGASIALQTNSLAVYTESVLGNVDQGWSYVNSGTLNSRRGHTAWMYNIEPITISVRGPLLQNVTANESPYDFSVTYTNDQTQPASENGWNFVPNPFASPINWNNSGWVKNNVNSQIAVWDVAAGQYRYTGVDWDGVIAQGQAFWIQTNAANPSLTCTESVKALVSDPTFYRKKSSEILSRLVISLKSELHTDKAVVQFNEESHAEFDSEFDAYKLKNLIFNLSTLTNEGANLAVNVLPKTSCTSSIRLNITNINPGTYALSFEGLGSFDNLRSMVLTDNFTGKSEKISESTVYSFEVTSDGKSFGAERFSLGFDFSDAKAQPVVTKEGSKLTSDYDEGNQWLVNGKVIPGATGKSIIAGQPGLYQVQVSEGSCLLVSESLTVKENVSRVYPNPATDEIKIELFGLLEDSYEAEGDIYLYSLNGELIRKEVFNKGDDIKAVRLDGIKPGVYMINLVTEKSNVIFRERIVIR
jgi:hypothetical protein